MARHTANSSQSQTEYFNCAFVSGIKKKLRGARCLSLFGYSITVSKVFHWRWLWDRAENFSGGAEASGPCPVNVSLFRAQSVVRCSTQFLCGRYSLSIHARVHLVFQTRLRHNGEMGGRSWDAQATRHSTRMLCSGLRSGMCDWRSSWKKTTSFKVLCPKNVSLDWKNAIFPVEWSFRCVKSVQMWEQSISCAPCEYERWVLQGIIDEPLKRLWRVAKTKCFRDYSFRNVALEDWNVVENADKHQCLKKSWNYVNVWMHRIVFRVL